MRIVEPSTKLIWITPNAEETIEYIARKCYKSEDKIGPGTAAVMMQRLKEKQHWPMFDHASASFEFITDRGVTHEMVRHRIAAYAQESTRYCNYSNESKFHGQISVIEPPFAYPSSDGIWTHAMEVAEQSYMALIHTGEKPEIARSVLPTCLKTEIVMTCSFTEWMHVFALRVAGTTGKPHPQMREVMSMAQRILAEQCPDVFDAPEEGHGESD